MVEYLHKYINENADDNTKNPKKYKYIVYGMGCMFYRAAMTTESFIDWYFPLSRLIRAQIFYYLPSNPSKFVKTDTGTYVMALGTQWRIYFKFTLSAHSYPTASPSLQRRNMFTYALKINIYVRSP